MKQALLFGVFFSLICLCVYSQDPVIRDPHAERFPLEGSFHAIQVSSAFECFVSQGGEESVAVSVYPEELRERVLITTNKGVLKIRLNEEKGWRGSLRKSKLRVYVSCKDLDQIELTGASQLQLLGGVKTDRLAITCSGASDVKGTVQAQELSITLTGASHASLKGNVNKLDVHASGASDFYGFDVTSTHCQVDASGASTIRVMVKEGLNILATGASTVDYKGEPRIHSVRTTGASTLNKRS